jgi:polyhydroxyalkanoate synthase
MSHRAADAQYIDPESWYAAAAAEDGSWWPAWLAWLDGQSNGRSSPPPIGAADKGYPVLEHAPGQYVLER